LGGRGVVMLVLLIIWGKGVRSSRLKKFKVRSSKFEVEEVQSSKFEVEEVQSSKFEVQG
jgi:hypothetical protein